MKIELEVCDCSGEAIVCKVTPTPAQLENIEKAMIANPSNMYEWHGDLPNVAETTVAGVSCISFLNDDSVLVMSIAGPDYMDCLSIWEDTEMQERAIADTWMLFVPHMKIFL